MRAIKWFSFVAILPLITGCGGDAGAGTGAAAAPAAGESVASNNNGGGGEGGGGIPYITSRGIVLSLWV